MHERVTDKNLENTNAWVYIKQHISFSQAFSWDTVQKNSTQKIKKAQWEEAKECHVYTQAFKN